MESVVVGTDQNRAEAIGTTGDQHPVQGAFADRIGENVSGNIGMRCSRMAQHKLRFLRRYRIVWSRWARRSAVSSILSGASVWPDSNLRRCSLQQWELFPPEAQASGAGGTLRHAVQKPSFDRRLDEVGQARSSSDLADAAAVARRD